MKYINGKPETSKTTDIYKKPKKKNDVWFQKQVGLDPSLKAEAQRDRERRDWEKEMHYPGELEHKRALVSTLQRESTSRTKEGPEPLSISAPRGAILLAKVTNQKKPETHYVWITESNAKHALSQKILRCALDGKSVFFHNRAGYLCEIEQMDFDRSLEVYIKK